MISKTQAENIEEIQKEISVLKKNKSELEEQRDGLSKAGLLGYLSGITLYKDRVVGQGRTIKLDSHVKASVETGGQISYSTETSGGGSRPTLTRIALGGVIAGPLGAVIGGTAQKKKKIKSSTTAHDNRTLRIVIDSDEGRIDVGLNPVLESQARNFTNQVTNAVSDYPRLKKEIEKEKAEITKKLDDLKKNDPVIQKEKELETALSKLSPEDRKQVKKIEKDTKTYFWVSIVSLALFYIPVLSTIGSIVSLIKSSKNQKTGLYTEKAKTTKIISIVGIFLSLLVLIIVVTL